MLEKHLKVVGYSNLFTAKAHKEDPLVDLGHEVCWSLGIPLM
jgi:hypothetical protein